MIPKTVLQGVSDMARQRIWAAYPRISGDEEYGNGLSSQLRGIRSYARENGVEIPDECVFEETHTGTVLDRPQLNRIKELMRTGKIDGVVVYDASRLARKVGVADFLLDEFEQTGVELHIVTWECAVNPAKARDRQAFNSEAVQSDTERRNILERTLRGKRDLLMDGIPIGQGRPPYGYRIEGRKRNKRYVKVPQQVEVITLIFDLYARERLNIPKITRYLNEHGYPPPSTDKMRKKGGDAMFKDIWTDRRVITILKNPLYIGRYEYGKTKVVDHKIGDDNKRVAVVREQKEAIGCFDLPELRIIDDDTFNYVQQQIADNRTLHNNTPKHDYLLARRMRCQCGYKSQSTYMTTRSRRYIYQYYVCHGQADKLVPDCPIPVRIQTPIADALVWSELETFIRNPALTLEKLKVAQSNQRTTHADAAATLERLEKKRAEYQQQLADLYQDFRFRKLIPEPVYEQLKVPLDRALAEAEEEYRIYQGRVAANVLSDDEIRTICKECADIAEQLDAIIAHEGELAFRHKRRIVDLLDLQVQLEAVESGVKFHLKIRGEELSKVVLDFEGNQHKLKDKGYPKQ